MGLTKRQIEVLAQLRTQFGSEAFWNSEAYPEHDNGANGARRVMWALKRAGYIVELPNHQWQLTDVNAPVARPEMDSERVMREADELFT